MNQGRTLVKSGNRVMYAGQAIIQASCAEGRCHNSAATGALRAGAPKGLDFNIEPVNASELGMDAEGNPIAIVPEADLNNLRIYQRKVFEEREAIWEQVKTDQMPPKGIGDMFRQTPFGELISGSAGGGNCPVTGELGPLEDDATKEVLRKWLACGTPVVEAYSPELAAPTPGVVGDQYPSCGMADTSFDSVYENVLMQCKSCHFAGGQAPSYDSVDDAFASLMGPNGQGGVPSNCADNPSPMVTPNNPDMSYIISKVGGGGEICGEPMPYGTPGLEPADIEIIRNWILAGAPAPGESSGGGDGGVQPEPEGDAGAGDGGT